MKKQQTTAIICEHTFCRPLRRVVYGSDLCPLRPLHLKRTQDAERGEEGPEGELRAHVHEEEGAEEEEDGVAGAGEGQAELKVGVGGRIRGESIDGVAAILVEKKLGDLFLLHKNNAEGKLAPKCRNKNSLWLLLLHQVVVLAARRRRGPDTASPAVATGGGGRLSPGIWFSGDFILAATGKAGD